MRTPITARTLVAECVELIKESDRGVILVGAAMLDVRLERAILARLRDDEKVACELFGPDRPLGSFGAKIKLAYLLGLLTDEERRELDLVRRVRNRAAHETGEAGFATFADQVKILTARIPAETGVRPFGRELTARERFALMVAGLAFSIEQATGAASRLEEIDRPAPPITLSFLIGLMIRFLPAAWDHFKAHDPVGVLQDVPIHEAMGRVLSALEQVFPLDETAGVAPPLLRVHADAAMALAATVEEVGAAADMARGAALDEIEARYSKAGPERSAALDEEADRWRAAGGALDAVAAALRRWTEMLADIVADERGGDGRAASALAVAAKNALRSYRDAAGALAEMGVEAPSEPALAGLFDLIEPPSCPDGEPT